MQILCKKQKGPLLFFAGDSLSASVCLLCKFDSEISHSLRQTLLVLRRQLRQRHAKASALHSHQIDSLLHRDGIDFTEQLLNEVS